MTSRSGLLALACSLACSDPGPEPHHRPGSEPTIAEPAPHTRSSNSSATGATGMPTGSANASASATTGSVALASASAAPAPSKPIPTGPRFTKDHPTCPIPDGFDGWSWKRLHRVTGLKERSLVLTLDVGARIENLEKVLDLLKEREVLTTIFLYTGELERHPRGKEVIKRMADDGHELANHTLSHKDLTKLEPSEVDEQFDRVEALVKAAANVSTKPFFREPFLATNDAIDAKIREKCYRPIWFTVDTADWNEGATAQSIERSVFEKKGKERTFEPGSIFIFHGSVKANLVALPSIIERFRRDGWSFLTLGEALKRSGGV